MVVKATGILVNSAFGGGIFSNANFIHFAFMAVH